MTQLQAALGKVKFATPTFYANPTDFKTIKVRHAFSYGFQGQAFYTWSHAAGSGDPKVVDDP